VVGITKKHNYAVVVQIYDVLIHKVRVVEVKGTTINLDILVEVVVGQLEVRSLIGQKSKKFVEESSLGSVVATV